MHSSIFSGTVHVVDAEGKATPVPSKRMAILKNAGDAVMLQSESSDEPARALLIAGKPLHEPIAQYGPFVMNTRDELMTAVEDFQAGRMG